MKKFILLFALLLSIGAAAQTFPGKRPDLLLGKEIKVKPIQLSQYVKGYKDFYSNDKLTSNYLAKDMYTHHTEIAALEGRVFKVTAVDPIPERDKYFRLTLLDELKKETLYYKYYAGFEPDFNFEIIGGLQFPADFYCEYIKQENLEGGKIKFATSPQDGITFTKTRDGNVTIYFMKINIRTNEKQTGKGAVVTLENGKVIKKPEAKTAGDDTPDKYGSYFYATIFPLTLEDIELLIDYKITGVKVMNASDPVLGGNMLKGMFACLIEKK